MGKLTNYLELGASLYVPANRTDLAEIYGGRKLGHVRSIIFCTEDSINESEVDSAVENLRTMLATVTPAQGRLHFIRVRNPDILRRVLGLNCIEAINGFVLPKTTEEALEEYLLSFKTGYRKSLKESSFVIMPTLETSEVFDQGKMRSLCRRMMEPDFRSSILTLRIGGNDLLNILGVRRSRYRTLYESPLGHVIANLVTTFKPHGFNLTSPVCELLYDHAILEQELQMDCDFGLYGKTAIHPDQVAVIEQYYMPSEAELLAAEALLAKDAPAVFNMGGAMCEVTTHTNWAKGVRDRAAIYGVFGKKQNALVKAA